MPTELLESALKLSVEERLQLVEEIWDSTAATQEAVPLTQAQIEELDRRKADLEVNSGGGSPRARLSSSNAGIRRAQALVRSYIPEGRRLSDELVEERRSQG
ncbi:MAG TPA: addiction module protein [Thermoanaerobaculia bacterium]|nr:addiction module protein [Thermoanaerobaculia bacterium]